MRKEERYPIGTRVRIIAPDRPVEEYGKDSDMNREGVIVGYVAEGCTVDFGAQYIFTHNAAGQYGPDRHYRHYSTFALEPIEPELDLDEITEEEILRCIDMR